MSLVHVRVHACQDVSVKTSNGVLALSTSYVSCMYASPYPVDVNVIVKQLCVLAALISWPDLSLKNLNSVYYYWC